MTRNFVFAVLTLVGAIVGLGMFGIPYTVSKAGFFLGIGYILTLGSVMLLLHLIYGEIVERTKGNHRLTGYVEKYLGGGYKKILGAVIIFSLYTALLAYIIVGGKFLALLFPEFGNSFIWSIVFWLIISIGIWKGIRAIARAEFFMTVLLVLFVFVLFAWGARDISFNNFSAFNAENFFLPYGVVLFALSGIFAIPEIRELLRVDGRRYRNVIIWGSIIPVILYIMFTILVVGVSGGGTSEEALSGLALSLGSSVSRVGAVFGLLAIATSFLVLGSNLKHTFEYDWHMPSILSTALTTVVPLLIFIAGVQHFIEVVSFAGGVLGALILIFVLIIYRQAITKGDKEPGYVMNLPKALAYGIIALFIFGGIYEIIYLIT